MQLKGAESESQPAAKKRKIDGEVPIHTNGNGGGVTVDEKNEVAQLAVAEISTVLPQRKKHTLEFTRSTIRARDPKTNEVVSGTGMPWRDVGTLPPSAKHILHSKRMKKIERLLLTLVRRIRLLPPCAREDAETVQLRAPPKIRYSP